MLLLLTIPHTVLRFRGLTGLHIIVLHLASTNRAFGLQPPAVLRKGTHGIIKAFFSLPPIRVFVVEDSAEEVPYVVALVLPVINRINSLALWTAGTVRKRIRNRTWWELGDGGSRGKRDAVTRNITALDGGGD